MRLHELALAHALAAASLAAGATPGRRWRASNTTTAIDLRGSKLLLNGAGVRYKAVFKVYAAGLYLRKKAGTAEEVLAAPGPKRDARSRCCATSTPRAGQAVHPRHGGQLGQERVVQADPRRAAHGPDVRRPEEAQDRRQLHRSTGSRARGTLVTVKGVPQGEPIKEPEFFNALLRIWLGPKPADWKLKDALLGKHGLSTPQLEPASRRSRRRPRRAPARRGCSRR